MTNNYNYHKMKIMNFFKSVAIVSIAVMAFVACEPNNVPVTPPDEPTPEEPITETYLELTSPDVMEFAAEGGVGEITWQEKEREVSRTDPYVGTVTTEAVWITLEQTTTGYGSTSFVVAANEGEAREAKIVITYHEQVIEVVVKQAAAPVEATQLAAAVRIPSADLDLENNNFVLMFVDDQENLELGIFLMGAEGAEVLAAGTYNVDNEGLVAEECVLQFYTDNGLEEYFYADGEVVVAVEGEDYDFDITLTTTEGEVQRYTYSGVVVDMVPEVKPAEPVAFTPASVKAELYEEGNFFLQLYINGSNYHELDMVDTIAPNSDYLSAGTYTFANETISSWSTYYLGNDQTCAFVDAEITLTHNADNTTKIVGYIKSEEGDHITIDWTGTVEGFVFPAPEPMELTIVSHTAEVVEANETEVRFYEADASCHIIDFCMDGLTPGSYNTADNTIIAKYCKYKYGTSEATNIADVEATIVDNGNSSYTFDVRFTTVKGSTYYFTYTSAAEVPDEPGVTILTSKGEAVEGTFTTYFLLSDVSGNNQVKIAFDNSVVDGETITANTYSVFQSEPSFILNGSQFSFEKNSLVVGGVSYSNNELSKVSCVVAEDGSITIKFTLNKVETTFKYVG